MNWSFNQSSNYKKILDDDKENKRAEIHSFHRYYGKLIPSIPRAYIKSFTKKGDTVGDLFSGSGTVAVEAKLMGRNFFGCEINPLSVFISKVKTTTYNIEILKSINTDIEKSIYDEKYLNSLPKRKKPFCVNMDHWFKPEVTADLLQILEIIDDKTSHLANDEKEKYKSFYYAVVSSIIRNISNADPQHVFPGILSRNCCSYISFCSCKAWLF